MNYLEKLQNAQLKNNSWLCIGLDPQPNHLPLPAARWDEPVLPFNRAIVEATADLVCAYKPNLGFYLQWGAAGVIALERTIAYIPDDIPIIIDCKTGDIGHTQAAWAAGLLDEWGVDAVTVNPFVGAEAVLPMIGNRPDKAVYVLARTSNPGASQLQGDLAQGQGLSAEVIRQSQSWPVQGHLGYVLGATYPQELATARRLAPQASFLIPGIGAQGGDLATAVQYGPDAVAGPVINASRSVIYASAGLDFAGAARAAAERLREEINRQRILLT
ncbi:MAG: orotidine-5'-phosphate decarboxylase [Chloroflexi bacterium]|nr:orotidine-5'-phosphate decarboxylase [Chloroflexota bacterium]MCI0577029.1 orotidine-5'-phosphate decarboxylase [Chloroflexota bacterium]MCI0648815.1 orotidine-5'-phosphate decarboxylase [Chloroflexota bacterium]MCI0726317.1 orotidine-5'-phosphate decarboxylase [Chloroflexota bacterium]